MPTSDYLTSGAPCPDFSLSGSGSGKDGETGWMYVAQVELFLLKQSKVIRLEMSANALEINDGKEVQQVITKLQTIYNIHTKVLKVWRYGDPTNRERLFIVGTLKRLTTDPALNDIKFEFPPPTHDTTNAPSFVNWQYPTGVCLHNTGGLTIRSELLERNLHRESCTSLQDEHLGWDHQDFQTQYNHGTASATHRPDSMAAVEDQS